MTEIIDRGASPSLYFGQVDLIYSHMPPARQDFLRLLITKFGNLKFALVNIQESLSGMLFSLNAFAESTQHNHVLVELLDEINLLLRELQRITQIHQFPKFSIRKKRKAWIKWQIFEFVEIQHKNISNENFEVLGAYLFCLLIDQKTNSQLPTILFKLLEHGHERLNEKEFRTLLKLESAARLAAIGEDASEEQLPFHKRIMFYYKQKIFFADPKRRQAVIDYKAYPIEDFKLKCIKIREQIQTKEALVNGVFHLLSMFSNLPLKYVLDIPVYENATDDWALALCVNEGTLLFDLSVIAPDGLKMLSDGYKKSSQVLIKPLPLFLSKAISEQVFLSAGQPKTLGDIFGRTLAFDEINSTKLINTFSVFAAQTVDMVMAGFLANDFRIFPTSKIYYHQSSRQEVWNASREVFQQLGWGEPVNYINGLNIGSSAVLTNQAVSGLFDYLAKNVESSRPSNNAGIQRLLNFHEQFTNYCATLSIFCLSLRNANPISIFADQVLYKNNFITLNDKNVHGAASLQPVTICKILREQYALYHAHCQSLLRRLEKSDDLKYLSLVKKLTAIADCHHTLLFVTKNSLGGLSSGEVAAAWPFEIPENFGRHYWASVFKSLNITDREISAHLRHQVASNLNWAGDGDLVLSKLVERIDDAQTQQLARLDISAIPGLVRN